MLDVFLSYLPVYLDSHLLGTRPMLHVGLKSFLVACLEGNSFRWTRILDIFATTCLKLADPWNLFMSTLLFDLYCSIHDFKREKGPWKHNMVCRYGPILLLYSSPHLPFFFLFKFLESGLGNHLMLKTWKMCNMTIRYVMIVLQAKGLISEYQPKFNSARAVYRERKKYADEIDWNMLAVPPTGSCKAMYMY